MPLNSLIVKNKKKGAPRTEAKTEWIADRDTRKRTFNNMMKGIKSKATALSGGTGANVITFIVAENGKCEIVVRRGVNELSAEDLSFYAQEARARYLELPN